ncbi:hypothetical protein N658DRAFT_53499 [Parathielavia hyrcaniae]|uniref:Uncharacterized protein n=1 Tax=Parathielavia hyrcaniae TaxID=113614 RepID=A0AAN6Q199_9PEZI|nr:hypothetical protein N658DRAFT_53499 [Parathielavia hyrcaniae]
MTRQWVGTTERTRGIDGMAAKSNEPPTHNWARFSRNKLRVTRPLIYARRQPTAVVRPVCSLTPIYQEQTMPTGSPHGLLSPQLAVRVTALYRKEASPLALPVSLQQLEASKALSPEAPATPVDLNHPGHPLNPHSSMTCVIHPPRAST